MLNSGKKKSRFERQKKNNILILVLSGIVFLNETKKPYPPPPPFKLNGRSLNIKYNQSNGIIHIFMVEILKRLKLVISLHNYNKRRNNQFNFMRSN